MTLTDAILRAALFHKNAADVSSPFLTAFQVKGSQTKTDAWLPAYILALKRKI